MERCPDASPRHAALLQHRGEAALAQAQGHAVQAGEHHANQERHEQDAAPRPKSTSSPKRARPSSDTPPSTSWATEFPGRSARSSNAAMKPAITPTPISQVPTAFAVSGVSAQDQRSSRRSAEPT